MGIAHNTRQEADYQTSFALNKTYLVLKLAYGHAGHLSVKALIHPRFTWPNIAKDIQNYVDSCKICMYKSLFNPRKAPMVARPITSEPFEAIAIASKG